MRKANATRNQGVQVKKRFVCPFIFPIGSNTYLFLLQIWFYNISETNLQQNSKIGIVKYSHNETKEQEYYGKQTFHLQLFGCEE